MVIAEKLGKTLTELRQTMTLEEVYLWQAFYQYRAEEEEKAMGGTEPAPRRSGGSGQIPSRDGGGRQRRQPPYPVKRIKKQRQSLESYAREGKAMFAKLRSLCAVPDREEVEEQDDSDEEEDLEKTELKEEVEDLKEEGRGAGAEGEARQGEEGVQGARGDQRWALQRLLLG